MAGAAVKAGSVRGFNCPSCGSAIVLHGMAWTQTVACASCMAILDAQDPNLRVLQSFERKLKVRPLIPLGALGEWKGAPYRVIGFQQRTITVEGVKYSWREYLLFNPYRGFRYLTEYDGHWNDVAPLPALPAETSRLAKPAATYGGKTYQHFQTARAETTFVLGEFPWEVRTGDMVTAKDYVAPPFMLSAESTDDETTWSLGEYTDPKAIWKAFKAPGSPPSPRGVFANQPSPYLKNARSYWKLFALFALVLVSMFLMRVVSARDARVFSADYRYDPSSTSQAFVTPVFELPGAEANVVIDTRADVANEWIFVEYALINERTGQAFDLGREVSFYSGRDSEGRWTEGSTSDRAKFGPVPGGRYFLRVEPSGQLQPGRQVAYTVTVRRDVPSFAFFLIGLLLLVAPPVFGALRAASFETQRWAESDHAPAGSDDDE